MSIQEINDKGSLKAALRQAFGDVIYASDKLSEEVFFTPASEGKWSPAQIVGHLILSTKPINKALSTPKLILRTTFGKLKRGGYSYDEVKERYLAIVSGISAPSSFEYNHVRDKGKSGLIQSFNVELEKINTHIDKWKESDMQSYQLPHPVLGKLSLKEMVYFTVIHTNHHRQQIESCITN